jgi:hypothetical protein
MGLSNCIKEAGCNYPLNILPWVYIFVRWRSFSACAIMHPGAVHVLLLAKGRIMDRPPYPALPLRLPGSVGAAGG